MGELEATISLYSYESCFILATRPVYTPMSPVLLPTSPVYTCYESCLYSLRVLSFPQPLRLYYPFSLFEPREGGWEQKNSVLVTEWAIRPNLMPPERFVRPIQLLYAALSTSLGRRPCGQTLQRLQTFRIANLPTLYEITLNSYHSVAGSYVAETGFPHLPLRIPLPTIRWETV